MSHQFKDILSQCPTAAAVIKNDQAGTILGTNSLLQDGDSALLAGVDSLSEAIQTDRLELTQMPIDNETWADHCDPVYSSTGFVRDTEGLIQPIKLMAARLDSAHCLLTIYPGPMPEASEASNESAGHRPSALELASVAYDVTENIPVGTYTMVLPPNQKMARFSFMSTRFLEITGLDRDTARSDPFKAFACIHPDDFDDWVALNAQSFENKTPFYGEARVVRDGQTYWIVAESNVRQRSDGSHVWEGAIMDVTRQKEAETALKQAHAQLLKQATQTARLEERQTLLEDLHDGFASQLAIAQHQLKQGKLSIDAISEILKNCHDDLHLIVHSLQTVEDNLSSALADWRHRLMNNHGEHVPKLTWDIRLERCPHLEPWAVLQILRVMQEAVANAIKHAQANQVLIGGHFTATDEIKLWVRDDGVGFDPTQVHRGQGLNNIKRRTQAVNGQLSWIALDPGIEMNLMIPIQANLCAT
ncbi:MAG: PAS domain-containing protein [Wenzhouxiangella sp.]|nr:PAS domain-containing protein [Wenzhouxiangella sp.]